MSKTYNILVADDEYPIQMEFPGYNWEKIGCKLLAVKKNGKEVCEYCDTHAVDIIITDITMPVMDGLEVLNYLLHRHPHIKTIVLSCHSDFCYAKDALKKGAVDYILKLELSEDTVFSAVNKAKGLLDNDKTIVPDQTDHLRDYFFYHPDQSSCDDTHIPGMYRTYTADDVESLRQEIRSCLMKKQPLSLLWMEPLAPIELKKLLITVVKSQFFEKSSKFMDEIWAAADLHDLEDAINQLLFYDAPENRYEITLALDLIDTQYEHNITLPVIADRVGLSPKYFSRLFNKTLGKTFNDYLTEYRMKKALEMITGSNLKIYQIAEKVGIPNYRYFSTVFKKAFGYSPKDYCERHNQGS